MTENKTSTLQEYWDACLIRSWRNHLRILDAITMFQSITGKQLDECELLRIPRNGIPWVINTRSFAAGYLPKISDRLWDQSPEKDVALLRKLSQSKYDTEKTQYKTNSNRELDNARRSTKKDREKKEFTTRIISERNSATDWNVTKGKSRVRMAR